MALPRGQCSLPWLCPLKESTTVLLCEVVCPVGYATRVSSYLDSVLVHFAWHVYVGITDRGGSVDCGRLVLYA